MFGDKEAVSKHLSLFSKAREEQDKAVPLIKPWFNNLTVQERVQALSTVDADVTRCIKAAHCKWRKQEHASTLKFRLKTNKAELLTQVQVSTGGEKTSNIQSRPTIIFIPVTRRRTRPLQRR